MCCGDQNQPPEDCSTPSKGSGLFLTQGSKKSYDTFLADVDRSGAGRIDRLPLPRAGQAWILVSISTGAGSACRPATGKAACSQALGASGPRRWPLSPTASRHPAGAGSAPCELSRPGAFCKKPGCGCLSADAASRSAACGVALRRKRRIGRRVTVTLRLPRETSGPRKEWPSWTHPFAWS
jgi:hypothetical protein